MHPSVFISHGPPNIVLQNSKSNINFAKFGSSLEMPKYIIIFSAHYISKDLKIISPKANKILYDFYGFEDELYDFKFDIHSDENLTNKLVSILKEKNIKVLIDENKIGYDHGAWTALALLYKKINIPVLQLSIPISYSFEQLINLGENLKVFKDEALIICSGSITHNISDISNNFKEKDYAINFNNKIKNIIETANKKELINIESDENFKKNHPTLEHFLPLFIAHGSSVDKKGVSFNSEILYSNISMESFIFDKGD